MSQRSRPAPRSQQRTQAAKQSAAPPPARRQKAPAKKLGYREQRELDELPSRIEQLETELEQLNTQLSDPEVYRESGDSIATVKRRADALQQELDSAYQRWEELESH